MRTCKLLLRPRPAARCKLQRTFSDATTIVAFCTEVSAELSSIELRQKGFFSWKEGHPQPDTDKERVRCCLARMQHHRSVSVQTDSRHCHWLPPLGLTMTALYLYGSSYSWRHPPSGASVSYSGQYSTLWPWQPRFESGYRHTPKSSESLTGFLFLCVCSVIKV